MRSATLVSLAFLCMACGSNPVRPAQPHVTPRPRASAVLALPAPAPPLARREALVEELHGIRVADPYRWLEDGDAPEVSAWASAYDDYSRAFLQTLPGRDATRARLSALFGIERRGAPIVRGARRFYWVRAAGAEREIWYVERDHHAPEVLLDPSKLGPDAGTLIRGVWPSHDGEYVAYKLGFHGGDQGVLAVRKVDTGEVLTEIPGTRYAQVAWKGDNRGFYYLRLPIDSDIPAEQLPQHMQLYEHDLHKPWTEDVVAHGKSAANTFLGGDTSSDGRWLFVQAYHSYSRNDLWFSPQQATPTFVPLAVGLDARFEALGWNGFIYLRTNYQAPNWRLLRVDPAHPAQAAWKEIIPERKDAVLQEVKVIGGHLALEYGRAASTELRIARMDGSTLREVPLPGIGTAHWQGEAEEDTASVEVSSFTQPYSLYSTSISKGGWSLAFMPEAGLDPDAFVTEQVFVTSRDGTRVSMFVIKPKAWSRDKPAKVLLTGYGGFSLSVQPRFHPFWFAWLEAGGIVAVPNLRGGGEYGEDWHRAGMGVHKQNVFDDFLAAAEYLHLGGYSCPATLAIEGASNGGLLVSAAMTQRPELFGAVVANVPLTDMVRFTARGHGSTWAGEYGSPDDKAALSALHAYSPYHRVGERRPYPALLVQTSDHDDRVDPMHARKLAAAVHHAQIGAAPVLLRVERNAGHNGGAGISQQVEHNVDVLTFLHAMLPSTCQ